MSEGADHPLLVSLRGKTFGRLTVISRAENVGGTVRWLCRCECGAEKAIRAKLLVGGNSRSCGCLARELTSMRSRRHGMTYSKVWQAWRGMHARCRDMRSDRNQYYGARGITVCDRWQSFEAFLLDMGPLPAPEYTLDRIDNDKGYSPENCRWATTTEQNRNKRSNVRLTLGEETMTTAEWARRIGMSHTGLADRLDDGWSVEKALTTPPMMRGVRARRKA